jgi:glycosyltransferase involved in cell wall biosynthesis
MPAFNASRHLRRAIESVRAQTFADWELVAVDDGSADETFQVLCDLQRSDDRIHPFRLPVNRGPAAARNHGLREARGATIAYLDSDDEFARDYLGWVDHYRTEADVLVFAYDLLEERPGAPDFGRVRTWNPDLVKSRLQEEHLACPLAVAHRRDLLDRVGLFDETWYLFGEDSDMWRRFHRAGATFLFLPLKSGTYHIRPDSHARQRPMPAAAQTSVPAAGDGPTHRFAARCCGLPDWRPEVGCWPEQGGPGGDAQRTGHRLLFCSYHSYFDPSSGAALCTRDLLELLRQSGWSCRVFTGAQLDFEEGESLAQLLVDQHLSYEVRPGATGPIPFSLLHFVQEGVPVSLYQSPLQRAYQAPTREEGFAFLALLEDVLDQFCPDVLLTYGGHWLARAVLRCARERGVHVAFALHNFAYEDATLFRDVDAVIVPSRFAQNHYRERLGIAATVLPGPWNPGRILCPPADRGYVTFVNPQPDKGVYWFVRIATELWRRRPDIPLLVVEGRGKADWLWRTGHDLADAGNLHVMANTPDPRDFYKLSRVVLMPSLWRESFGRVAVEALMNGIPVLASRRGGLGETLNGAGFLFDIPAEYTPASTRVPTAAEVTPWVETIVRLWEDGTFYDEQRWRCLAAAQAWQAERLVPRFEAFFTDLLAAPARGQQ